MRGLFLKKLCGSLCFCGSLWAALLMAKPLDVSGLDDLAVQDHGRKKPFYTFAVEQLRFISGKDDWRDADGAVWPAENVVLGLWLDWDTWRDRPLVLVDNLLLKERLGLPKHERYFSYQTLRMSAGFAPALASADEAAGRLARQMARVENLRDGALRILPDQRHAQDEWLPMRLIVTADYSQAEQERIREAFEQLVENYHADDEAGTRAAAWTFKQRLRALAPAVYPSARILKLENLYARLDLFGWAWKAYLLAAVTLMLTTRLWRRAGYRCGMALALAGFACQGVGFALRVTVAGRAPVTNMYETVIWLGFAAVLFALIFELVCRSRYFLLGATPVAFVSLLLAETQSQALDSTIQPLAPVLRSNFWLSTHVLTITSSYAAFALALAVGHMVLGRLLFRRPVPPVLYQYLYRTLQVGVLLLGIGTMLGGVWANYAWGRFWDWDPKETWALITFLCYLVVLHGRIAGWWGGVGLAVGSVLGFLSVLMAWYGVNFVLGTGLHSYGFGAGGFAYALGLVIFELAVVTLALVSHRRARAAGQA
ncbi:MAG: cytochrome c biogenesis protein CcsA [Verrucomicrobiales bacterium]|jgi:ABC-type transport system involved in cytochrome c biogenesis permease subunit|nr:cytochrome c biogenesis protein CcsA [Verrucomicrobiales bacterium]